MKTGSWKIAFAALACFPILGGAQGVPMPKKYENAPPAVRAAAGYPPFAEEAPPPVNLEELRLRAGRDEPNCAAVKVSGPVTFRGRTLVEIPDITEPDLRLANQLMSTGCFERAFDRLEAVLRADPGNRNAKYVMARMAWFELDGAAAERVLQQALAEHSDFVSAKVLLAGIRFEQGKLADAARLLDETEPRSPTDMWIYLGRMRLEGLRSPSRDLRLRALEIARNPAFPPNARGGAGDVAKHLPNQTDKEYEEVLWARYNIDSNTIMPCMAAELAMWIGEQEQRYPDVIKLLESPRAKAGHCSGLNTNRTLLAQAYLMEAAKISAGPSPANKHLLDRVDQILNGDYTSVAQYVVGRPQAAKLQPFLVTYVQPDEEDENGVTVLCHALGQLDVELVRAQLDAGANPNGRCRDESLVGSLVFMATVKKPEQRREILRALLEHGATVTNIDGCRPDADCAKVLLPLMEKYSGAATKR